MLQENGKEKQAAVIRKAKNEGSKVGYREGALPEQRQRQQGTRGARFHQRKQEQADQRQQQGRHRDGACKAMLAGFDQAVRQGAQADHAQYLAKRIECRLFWMLALGNAPQAQRQCDQAQRKVDQENSLPAGAMQQQAAEQRSQDQRQCREGGPAADGMGALFRLRKCMRQDGHGAGDQQGAGHALDCPAGKQGAECAGHAADGRAYGEQEDASEPGELVPIAVAQRSGRQHECRQADGVGVDNPLQSRDIGLQCGL
ncbi:hypothetical protein D3C81_1001660 [compost metagenome]